MAQEKRKDKRVKEDFSILCRMYKRTELEGDVSKILDISKSGLCFLSDTKLDKNNIVQLTFRIPPYFKEKIELFARIIESSKAGETEFKTRVSFINITSSTESALEKIIGQASFKAALKKED